MVREELALHLRLGDFNSAADLYLQLGDVGNAVNMFVKAGKCPGFDISVIRDKRAGSCPCMRILL